MTYESDQAGMLEIVAAEGDTLPVGAVIAHIGDGAAAAPVVSRPTPAPPRERQDGERVKASPLARRLAGDSGVDLRALSGSGPGGRIVKADVLGAAADPPASAGQAPAGAPVPARSGGVAPGAGATPGAAPGNVMTAKGETTEVELSRTQQTVARRMAESKATIPDFTLLVDVDMEECVKLRTQLKRLSHPDHSGGETAAREALKAPTYNDMVV
jgi:pyruvate dehydrogenase E2 component (dihydrolipoamide acetyltransferase)